LTHTKYKKGKIDNQYIFVMHKTVTDEQRVAFASQMETDGHKVMRHFRISEFHGVSVRTAGANVDSYVLAQASHPHVRYVEQDQWAQIAQVGTCFSQTNAIWGLDRISEIELNLDGRYVYDSDGTAVDAYVIDTGVLTTHSQFGGRALWGATFTDDGYNYDCNGHGTHVGGTIGGVTYGVAKKVTVIAVKVLDCEGSGSYSGVIAGIEWVANSAVSRRRPSVANMSLGGPISDAVDDAVDAAIASGVVFAVAAGNENSDACKTSPANVKAAITVGATEIEDDAGNQADERSPFSNWGTCLDIFAPGSLITSSWIGGNNAIKTISGTSMATPFVAGVVARYLTLEPNATPAEVNTWLVQNSNKGVLNLDCTSSTTTCKSSPNRLLYAACQ